MPNGKKLSPVLQVFVDGNGEVVKVVNMLGNPLEEIDYEKESRKIDEDAMLATENWCRWKLVAGKWKCVPV